ncbi:E3 ubiquitin-protein ligase HERC [Acrasis kona]|uniref:E3 ubiquitin-protein ligase HERC n=1 Tax=Acrasis kona TaxID=1008807 RepID=A0AAW2YIK2_9EUKA
MSLRLIVLGGNYKGQVGVEDATTQYERSKPMNPREKELQASLQVPFPINVSTFGNATIKKVVTKSYSTFIVTTDHKVFCCGDNLFYQLGLVGAKRTPQTKYNRVTSLDHVNVTDVACGFHFTLFLSLNGDVYGCGDNSFGQLGMENEKAGAVAIPTLIKDLENVVITKISAGEQFSAFLTSDSTILTCGANDKRQLGHSRIDNVFTPTLIDSKFNKNVVDVMCGNTHLSFLTREGDVFFFGENQCGQFGVADHADDEPQPIKLKLQDKLVHRLLSNFQHTHVITSDHSVYACGRAIEGQLSTPTIHNHAEMIDKAVLPNGWQSALQFDDIYQGPYNTAVVGKDNELYMCGMNYYHQMPIIKQQQKSTEPEFVLVPKGRAFLDSTMMKGCTLRVAMGESHTILYYTSDKLNVVLTHFFNHMQKISQFADVVIKCHEENEGEPATKRRRMN